MALFEVDGDRSPQYGVGLVQRAYVVFAVAGMFRCSYPWGRPWLRCRPGRTNQLTSARRAKGVSCDFQLLTRRLAKRLAGCPRRRAKSRPRRSSSPIRSATSTLTSPRSRPKKASSICLSPSTGHRSSPMWSCTASLPTDGLGFPQSPYQSRSLQNSYCAHRQWYPVRRAAQEPHRTDGAVVGGYLR